MNDAFERLLTIHPELETSRRGLPFPGTRKDGLTFFDDVKVIDEAFVNSNIMYSYETIIDTRLVLFNAGAGSPLYTKPYPPATKAIREIAGSEKLSQYQLAAGDAECRQSIVEWLNEEGFGCNYELTSSNIIFTHSTTEGFDFLIKLLTRAYDAVLFSGPTYGLFVYVPERNNAISKIIPLSKDDDWLINPQKLDTKIQKINRELEELGKKLNLSYKPCCVAYVNINPNNPTGKVMTEKHIPLLRELYATCEKNGMWIIDDLIYRELVYDADKKAIAMATIEGLGKNVISMLGPSKSYGLAGVRAGMIIADEIVIRGIRPIVFQHMDSTSLITGTILKACYNHSEEHEKYFDIIRSEYRKKYQLIRMLIEGVDSIDEEYSNYYKEIIASKYPDCWKQIIEPIDDIKVVEEIYPESGFFLMLDFTASKGKRYKEVCINSESDILYFYYVYAYVKLLMGKSIGWPNGEQFIARVSFSFSDDEIILMIKQMKDAARRLE